MANLPMPTPASRFDRTVTLSLIFAVALQTAGALLWAGAAEARLLSLEAIHNTHPPMSERLARIEEQMEMTRLTLTRIEARIEARLTPKP